MLFVRLTILKLKRMLRFLPGILAGALALCLVTGVIAFGASLLLYEGQGVDKQEVGMVYPAEDKYVPLVINMLENMDSVSALAEFIPVDSEEAAMKALASGELDGAVIFPEDFVHGLYYGEDVSARVILPTSLGVYTRLFKGLADNGMSMFSYVQSAVGAAAYSARDEYSGRDMDMTFLGLYLQRDRLFRQESISAAGSLATGEYYLCMGSATVLLLMGMCLGFALGGENTALRFALKGRGIGRASIFASEVLVMLVFYLVAIALFVTGLYLAGLDIRVDVPALVLGAVLLAFMVAGVYSVLTPWSGALAILAVTLFSAGMGGALLPAAFLPEQVAAVGELCPIYLLFTLISNIFYDSFTFNEMGLYFTTLGLCLGCPLAVSLYREVRER